MSFISCTLSELPEGPWLEDHKLHPEKEYTFDCGDSIVGKVKRMPGWNWNGYVVLPSHHPDYSKTYDDLEADIQVYGGLTYGPGNGTFGFDTAHFSDLVPSNLVLANDLKFGKLFKPIDLFDISSPSHFWTFEEVKAEVKSVAEQFVRRKSYPEIK